MFDDKFIENLSEDKKIALRDLCSEYLDVYKKEGVHSNNYEKYLEGLGVINAFMDLNNFDYKNVEIIGKSNEDMNNIIAYILAIFENANRKIASYLPKRKAKEKVENSKQLFLYKFGNIFHYGFSDNDLEEIQRLIDKLRKLISSSEEIEQNHKNRLLKRLEKLQSELHKKTSNLDRFYGLIIEASIVYRKVGENAKPIIDCVKKIIDILSPIISEANGLPSSFKLPLLESKKDEET